MSNEDSNGINLNVLWTTQSEIHASLQRARTIVSLLSIGVTGFLMIIGLAAGLFGSVLYAVILMLGFCAVALFNAINLDEWRRAQMKFGLNQNGMACMISAAVASLPTFFVVIISITAVFDAGDSGTALYRAVVIIAWILALVGSVAFMYFVRRIMPENDDEADES